MKNETALSKFKPLQLQMEKDKDPYLFVHFSREEDAFKGVTSNRMDGADAIIVINHLINRFNLSAEVIAAMAK